MESIGFQSRSNQDEAFWPRVYARGNRAFYPRLRPELANQSVYEVQPDFVGALYFWGKLGDPSAGEAEHLAWLGYGKSPIFQG
jgi:hypothetical protein